MNHFAIAWLVLGLAGSALAERPDAPDTPGKVPEKKWFVQDKGYAEALALQKETGADIIVYVSQYAPPDRKGLSTWFERKGLQHGQMVDGLRPYLKVRVALPLSKKDEAAFSALKISNGPALHVVQTNGRSYRIGPFDWPGGKPEIKDPAALLQEIRSRSGPRYQVETDKK